MTPKAYEAVASALLALPSVNDLSLHVIDNTFNAEKAETLHRMLQAKSLQAFSFLNTAIELDWKEEEYSNFEKNIDPIIELEATPSYIIWDSDMHGL